MRLDEIQRIQVHGFDAARLLAGIGKQGLGGQHVASSGRRAYEHDSFRRHAKSARERRKVILRAL